MNLEKIVCECFGVTGQMIKDAVTNGASTLEDIQEMTGAATGCGVCTDEIEQLLGYFATEKGSS